MPVIEMCEKTDPGAMLWSGPSGGHEVYIRKTFVGCVVAGREANGYDDSDFYCTVWDADKNCFREIMFATTRGWSYPCYGTSVDATAEVRARYEEHLKAEALAYRERKAELDKKRVKVGRRVKVVGGRKVALGSEWWVVSIEADRFNRYAERVGLRSDEGARAWTAASNLMVIALEEVS